MIKTLSALLIIFIGQGNAFAKHYFSIPKPYFHHEKSGGKSGVKSDLEKDKKRSVRFFFQKSFSKIIRYRRPRILRKTFPYSYQNSFSKKASNLLTSFNSFDFNKFRLVLFGCCMSSSSNCF
jgi:hypothetical protein